MVSRAAREGSGQDRRVIIVRHAAASGQAADAALTAAGQRQASMLAELLSSLCVERVICSPLLRAIQSVEPFCARARVQFEVEPRLCERVLSPHDLPDWREHLRRSFEDLDYRLEDGESSRDAQQRGMQVVQEAVESGKRCALITHGNLLSLMLKSVDEGIGFEAWSRLTNPDAFALQLERGAPARVDRLWDDAETLPVERSARLVILDRSKKP
jgi:2,3-bisphosphoglycerate-dependent phosphoglycerate mutase